MHFAGQLLDEFDSLATSCAAIIAARRFGPTHCVAPIDVVWHNKNAGWRWAPAAGGDVMRNGLYSIHVTLLDGRIGKGSGVVVFRDGKIVGGDAYLFYTGSYTVKGNTFKGEVLVQRHTSSPDENPLFGGPSPVGVGVSGTFTDTCGEMTGTALVDKTSQIFGATLRRLSDVD
jgi:hypothetical protein